MEFFFPSVIILLLAAAVIFFVLPRFGAATLALLSVVLLGLGVYHHIQAFGTEYRFGSFQGGYAPYLMVGGVLAVIGIYLLALSPLGKPNTTVPSMPELPTVAEMPTANTATNVVTAGVNTALKGLTNAAAAVGIGNAAKENNGKGVVGNATAAVKNVANQAVAGVTNAVTTVTNLFTGNAKEGNQNKPANTRNRTLDLGFPLSQI